MRNDTLLISVIVPTYNRLGVLQRVLSRIGRQTVARERYEVIVVDDASSDGTWEYIRTLENVRRYRNATNRGRAVTRNVGIANARAGIILFLDDDILADSRLIEAHLEKHRQCGAVAVVGAVVPSPDIKKTAVNLYYNRHHDWCRREMRKASESLPYQFLKTANLSVPAHIFSLIGAFDERFRSYGGEDTELGRRMSASSIGMVFADDAIGYHWHDETVDSMMLKMGSVVHSARIFGQMDDGRSERYDGFFTHEYHPNTSMRYIAYNIAKKVAFTRTGGLINERIVRRYNDRPQMFSILTRLNIPLLGMQCRRQAEEAERCE